MAARVQQSRDLLFHLIRISVPMHAAKLNFSDFQSCRWCISTHSPLSLFGFTNQNFVHQGHCSKALVYEVGPTNQMALVYEGHFSLQVAGFVLRAQIVNM